MTRSSRLHIHRFHRIPRFALQVALVIFHLLTRLQGWSIFIQAQQVLVSATQFIGDLNKCLASQSGMYYMFERMQQLDAWTQSVISQAELLPLLPQTSDFGDHNESITAQSIRAISRIKLSRFEPITISCLNQTNRSQCPNQNPPLPSLLRHPPLHQKTLRPDSSKP